MVGTSLAAGQTAGNLSLFPTGVGLEALPLASSALSKALADPESCRVLEQDGGGAG